MKTEARTNWILENKAAINNSRTALEGSSHNARFNRGMSSGGYGWWANALESAGIECDRMPYWSGSAPTYSIAINRGIAKFINNNAPRELK